MINKNKSEIKKKENNNIFDLSSSSEVILKKTKPIIIAITQDTQIMISL